MALVGAAVADEMPAEAEEAPVAPDRELERADDLLRVAARGEVLVAVLDPLHRSPGDAGEQRQDRLLDVEVDLEPEPAADGRDDHPDPRLRQAVEPREHRADEERHLRRVPEGQLSGCFVPIGDAAASLERRRVRPAEVETLAEDVGGAREDCVDVARLVLDVGEVAVGVGRQRFLGVDHRRERLVLHLHQLARILGRVPGRRHDRRDRIPDVSHPVEREQRSPSLLRLGPARGGDDLEPLGKVCGGDDGCDAVELPGAVDVDAPDRGMAERAAHERGVQRSRHADVVDVAGPSAQQARVLDPGHALPHVAERPTHASARSRRAASLTAATMPV